MFHFVHKKNRARTSANPILNTMASLWLLQLLMFIRFVLSVQKYCFILLCTMPKIDDS